MVQIVILEKATEPKYGPMYKKDKRKKETVIQTLENYKDSFEHLRWVETH